jgi:hypothetical protein
VAGNIERCWITFSDSGRPQMAFGSAEDAARDVLADERASYAAEYVHADLMQELVDHVRRVGEHHGFSWEPDCSAKSMLAKLDNELLLARRRPKNVHVVEVFDRTDGTYVFASHDDAVAFEEAVINAGHDVSLGSRCLRREEVVCDHADTLKLIESERDDS